MSSPVNAWVTVTQGRKAAYQMTKIMPGYPASGQMRKYWLILHVNKDQQVQFLRSTHVIKIGHLHFYTLVTLTEWTCLISLFVHKKLFSYFLMCEHMYF